jgi:PIN like domain
MKFFLDNCLPPRWAPALSALSEPGEFKVEHLRHKFSQNVSDIDWIKKLADEGGWTIISGDVRITKSIHERQAWLSSGMTAFFLVKGWDFVFWEKTARIIRWWPKILEQTQMIQPGAGFYVPVNYKSGKFEQVPLSSNPS